MTKAIYFGQTNRVSADNQRLARVGRKIFVGFIAIFTAILAKIKWFVDQARKRIGIYDQVVFWTGHFACGFVATMIIISIASEENPETGGLLFMICFLYCIFYLLLQETVKDKNGESHWP